MFPLVNAHVEFLPFLFKGLILHLLLHARNCQFLNGLFVVAQRIMLRDKLLLYPVHVNVRLVLDQSNVAFELELFLSQLSFLLLCECFFRNVKDGLLLYSFRLLREPKFLFVCIECLFVLFKRVDIENIGQSSVKLRLLFNFDRLTLSCSILRRSHKMKAVATLVGVRSLGL